MPVTINSPGAAGTSPAPIIPPPPDPTATQAIPAAESAPVVLPSNPFLGLYTSSDHSGHVRMPHISSARPRVAGEEPIDRGEDAEFFVNHQKVGHLHYGSTVTREDLGDNANIAWLLRIDAIRRLKPEAAAPAPSDPAAPKTKTK